MAKKKAIESVKIASNVFISKFQGIMADKETSIVS